MIIFCLAAFVFTGAADRMLRWERSHSTVIIWAVALSIGGIILAVLFGRRDLPPKQRPHAGDVSFEELAEFVRAFSGISWKKQITPESLFEDDLGITGDDGCELLVATEQYFGVHLSSEEHGYRETFDLGPNEYLFHSEGMFSFNSLESIRAFTVGELYRVVQEKLRKEQS